MRVSSTVGVRRLPVFYMSAMEDVFPKLQVWVGGRRLHFGGRSGFDDGGSGPKTRVVCPAKGGVGLQRLQRFQAGGSQVVLRQLSLRATIIILYCKNEVPSMK
jgi:hypothetical protein